MNQLIMILTFRQQENLLTLQDLNDFEDLICLVLPPDYKQHMLLYNGGIVNEDVKHINYLDGGEGISKFYPIKYGNYKMVIIFYKLMLNLRFLVQKQIG